MKVFLRILLGWVAVLALLAPPVGAAGAAGGSCPWAGEYQTGWGKLHLTQNGSKITGSYGATWKNQGGKVIGHAAGNTMTGRWQRSDGRSAGWFQFGLAADCYSFKGRWGWDQQAKDAQPVGWNGHRLSPLQPLPKDDQAKRLPPGEPQPVPLPPGDPQSSRPEPPVKRQKIVISALEPYGVDYNDNDGICFKTEQKIVKMGDSKANCKRGRYNAVWEGRHWFEGETMILEIRGLRSPYAPDHKLGIGYTVTLVGAYFIDGSNTKNIMVYTFSGKPKKTLIRREVKLKRMPVR